MKIAEIFKSRWCLYSNENGDFQACRCSIRRAPKASGIRQKQSEGQPGGMRKPGGGVRGGKPLSLIHI